MIILHDGQFGDGVASYRMCPTVLLVDNDRVVAGLVAELLGEEGFEVRRLANTQLCSVEDEVESLEPNLVLLDGSDSGGYGQSWSVAAWLRARVPAIPVIMFTAHATELFEARLSATDRSQQAGFVDFVAKPFDLGVLVDAVKRALAQYRASCKHE